MQSLGTGKRIEKIVLVFSDGTKKQIDASRHFGESVFVCPSGDAYFVCDGGKDEAAVIFNKKVYFLSLKSIFNDFRNQLKNSVKQEKINLAVRVCNFKKRFFASCTEAVPAMESGDYRHK